MITNKLFLFNLVLFFFLTQFLNGQTQSIYSKEIVYTYNYAITKNEQLQSGIIYLGCIGKLDERTEQYKVTWTKNINFLLEKLNTTGIGEDSARIFTHPPRFDEFTILEFTPFPYAKYPLNEGTTWSWNLSTGKYWANKSQLVENDDVFTYSYQIGKSSCGHFMFSPFPLNYFEIKGVTEHPKLSYSFKGYFNDRYGFIYCEFNNIDHSIITLNLKEVCSYEELKESNRFNKLIF